MAQWGKTILPTVILSVFLIVVGLFFGVNIVKTTITVVLTIDSILIFIIFIKNIQSIWVEINKRPQIDLNWTNYETFSESLDTLLELITQLTIVSKYSAKIFKTIPLFVMLIFSAMINLFCQIVFK